MVSLLSDHALADRMILSIFIVLKIVTTIHLSGSISPIGSLRQSGRSRDAFSARMQLPRAWACEPSSKLAHCNEWGLSDHLADFQGRKPKHRAQA